MKNLRGKRFSRLTVIELGTPRGKGSYWLCRCDCGGTNTVRSDALASGQVQSCGCLCVESSGNRARRHGRSKSAEHRAWSALKCRCLNPNATSYEHYGGRGITVCERWKNSFEAFFDDMGPRPSSLYSIDRIDVNQGYSPENCRWATAKTQRRNSRQNKYLSFRGRTQTLVEWAEETGLSAGAIRLRLSKGWTIERALTTPWIPRHRRFLEVVSTRACL